MNGSGTAWARRPGAAFASHPHQLRWRYAKEGPM